MERDNHREHSSPAPLPNLLRVREKINEALALDKELEELWVYYDESGDVTHLEHIEKLTEQLAIQAQYIQTFIQPLSVSPEDGFNIAVIRQAVETRQDQLSML